VGAIPTKSIDAVPNDNALRLFVACADLRQQAVEGKMNLLANILSMAMLEAKRECRAFSAAGTA
jgi:hypothetical protein